MRWYHKLEKWCVNFFKIVFLIAGLFCMVPLFLIWKAEIKWSIHYNKDQITDAQSAKVFALNVMDDIVIYHMLFYGFVIFAAALVLFLVCKMLEAAKKRRRTPANRIESLRERCNALITEEKGGDEELNIGGISSSFFGGGREKTTRKFAIASTKEIEYELQEFLSQTEKEFKVKFIFIFDELDKIDPVVTSTFLYEDMDKFQKTENANPRDFRDRKQAIINIVAGLKNFFTAAKARFIFIAGNEMFDAALADIADRQASLSSIFTYTFHIESFLKEKKLGNRENDSLSLAIEEHLKWVLFKEEDTMEDIQSLIIRKLDKKLEYPAIVKVIFILQNFITYLTYRANGSPKKIIKIIQEFILVEKEDCFIDDCKTILLSNSIKTTTKDKNHTKLFLHFNYTDQYRIGFISYLYRPFLIQYGRNFKLFSDNIIISTPYLFDHLLKFHPFAFSLSNLELIPEVVSTNKTPSLQEHLGNIVNYLGENHIRKTDLGLFDYKFFSRTLNEISYISKLFEEEAAAFNFTLDESYIVKIYVRSKIKELRSIYSKFLGSTTAAASKQIFSIAHLNGVLGDLHFFDQEYDDAIVSYSDAIRPINNQEIIGMSIREFITLYRNKLKLGLCFERTSSYEEALAFYADCCQDAKRFMMYRILAGKTIDEIKEFDNKIMYETSSLIDLLQIIIQGFFATIVVEEKIGMKGITVKKINRALGNFLNLTFKTFQKEIDNTFVFANVFLLTGKLFYFKNTSEIENGFDNFPEIFTSKFQTLDKLYRNTYLVAHPKPAVGLYMYLTGLCEIIDFKIVKDIPYATAIEFFTDLLLKLEDLENDDIKFDGFHNKYIADLLSSIGDSLLSMCHIEEHGEYSYRKISITDLFKKGLKDNTPLCEILSADHGIAQIIRCYYLSGRFFLKYGRSVSCSYEYKKILYLLKTVITGVDDKEIFLNLINNQLIKPALKFASQNSAHTDRHMFQKVEKSFEREGVNKELITSSILNNISNNAETREIIIVFNYIKLKLGTVEKFDNLISSSNSLSTQYLRLMELEFYAKYKFPNQITDDIMQSGESGVHKISNLDTIDYLFSMLSMLRIQKIYGNDFLIGHSSFAYNHLRIARFLKHHPPDEDVKVAVEELLGKGSYISFDSTYHYQMARDLYSRVIQLHTAGEEYRKVISDLIYLEDDFSDTAYHFGAAINRYLMINDDFKNKIEECDIEIEMDPHKYYNSHNYN